MSKLHRKLIRISRDLINLPDSSCKHFTFICERNKIISVGWNNSWKTRPEAAKYGHRFNSIHAEVDAIKKFPHNIALLPKYSLYNVRLLKSGRVAMSRPCGPCSKLLFDFGVSKLFYTNNFGEFVRWQM